MANRSLTAVLGFVGVCLAGNALIFGLGFDSSANPAKQPGFAPAGWVIGAVWLGLFALMGLIYARLVKVKPSARWTMLALAAACLAYPIYTSGLQNAVVGLVGNIATLAATVGLVAYYLRFDRVSALLLVPMMVWLTIASFLTAIVAGVV